MLPFPVATLAIDILFVFPTLPKSIPSDDPNDPRNQLKKLSVFTIQRPTKLVYVYAMHAVHKQPLDQFVNNESIPVVNRLRQLTYFLRYSALDRPFDEYDRTHQALTEYLQRHPTTNLDSLFIESIHLLNEKGVTNY